LHLDKAELVVSTIPQVDDQNTLIRFLRQSGGKAVFIANLHHPSRLNDVYKAGADYVMMPHLLGGSWISNILKEKSWTANTFKKLRLEQKKEMKQRFEARTHV